MKYQNRKKVGICITIIGLIFILYIILNLILPLRLFDNQLNKFPSNILYIFNGILIIIIGLSVFQSKSKKLFDMERLISGKFFGNQKYNIIVSIIFFALFEIFMLWAIFHTDCSASCPNNLLFYLTQILKATLISFFASLILYIGLVIRFAWWDK